MRFGLKRSTEIRRQEKGCLSDRAKGRFNEAALRVSRVDVPWTYWHPGGLGQPGRRQDPSRAGGAGPEHREVGLHTTLEHRILKQQTLMRNWFSIRSLYVTA